MKITACILLLSVFINGWSAVTSCRCYGDVHFVTYNGVNGSSQGVCTYLMTETADGTRVLLETEDRGTGKRSWGKRVIIDTNFETNTYELTHSTVKMGITTYNMDEFTKEENDDVVIEAVEDEICVTDKGSAYNFKVCMSKLRPALRIIANPNGGYKGICGSYDGNPGSDLVGRDGNIQPSFKAMVASWKEDDTCTNP